jgi:hypothetical protein
MKKTPKTTCPQGNGQSAFTRRAVRGRRVAGRFFGTNACRFRHGEALLQSRRSRDLSKANVWRLHVPTGNRALADAAADRGVSSDQNRGLFSPARRLFKALLAPVVQYHFNRSGEVFQTCFAGPALSIGFGHLRAEGDKPLAVPLDNSRVAVSHADKLHAGCPTANLKSQRAMRYQTSCRRIVRWKVTRCRLQIRASSPRPLSFKTRKQKSNENKLQNHVPAL